MKILMALAMMMSALSADEAWISLSKVGGLKAFKGQVALFGVKEELDKLTFEFRGSGADSFTVGEARKEENGLLLLEVLFQPTTERGFFQAELVVSSEKPQIVHLRGVATPALEGKNEPPLHQIVQAFGAPLKVGGTALSLNTQKKTIGDSLAVSEFEPVKDAVVKVTPLARYSPPGKAPFGVVTQEGQELKLRIVGELAATEKNRPDAHQTLHPPLADGSKSVVVANPPARFGLFLEAHKYTSLTLPGRSEGAPIQHTARIYPVESFQGRAAKNSYLVGFEEASNGDYQDAVFLIEGVRAVK